MTFNIFKEMTFKRREIVCSYVVKTVLNFIVKMIMHKFFGFHEPENKLRNFFVTIIRKNGAFRSVKFSNSCTAFFQDVFYV